MTRLRSVGVALVSFALLIGLLSLAWRFHGLPEGLRGNYFSTADWTGELVQSTIDPQPSTANIVAAWGNRPPPVFSVMWTGSLLVPRDGIYTIATTSDDGSWVYVDGQLLLDLGGTHAPITLARSIDLQQGVHAIAIKYFQGGGDFGLNLSWGRGDQPLAAIPSWALTPKRPRFGQFVLAVVLGRSLAAMEWLLAPAMLIGIVVAAWPRIVGASRVVRRDAAWRAVAAVIAGSLVLNVIGIWYGLSSHGTWLGDEIGPNQVIVAISQLFSRGWWAWYPPLQYYILAAVDSPVVLLERVGRIDPRSLFWFDVMFLLERLVSVAAGVGVLIATYLSGAEAFSKRVGLFAAASLALVGLFICYSKTANVDIPYVFWFALSILFYLRILREPTLRNIVFFSAAGALAICTKDQAYGLYAGAPFVVVYAIARARQQAGDSHPFARALVDRRIIAAAATGIVVFAACYNILFNYSGFMSHLHYILTDGRIVRDFGLFDLRLLERWRVLVLTATLDKRSLGWPMLAISSVGWILALRSPATRGASIALSIVVIAYYLTFINVIMYCYDRFLLPVCLVQALFAGVAFERWLDPSAARLPARQLIAGSVFAYSLLYGGMVDALMLRDSRYAVEAWLHAHASAGEDIGTTFANRNRPTLADFHVDIIDTVPDLKALAPPFYVFDAEYARAIDANSPAGELIDGLRRGTLGYRLALRYRAPTPWGWLAGAHPELAGPRLDRSTSSFREINPTLEVYERTP